MILFKGYKPVKISKNDYNIIMQIKADSSCDAVAIDKINKYLKNNYDYFKTLKNYIIKEFSYYLLNACYYNYKYLKIID